MKILITGGFGYLGLKISKFLSEKGYDIRIFDLSKPDKYEFDKYEVYFGNVLDKDKVKKACDGVDFVIHLVGLDQQKCKENPKLAMQVNGLGTKNVLEAAKETGVKRFIYMSTFHIYGRPHGIVDEETIPSPLTDYAVTKLKGEDYCTQFNNDMKCIVLRLSNAYGAPLTNLGWSLAVNDFCRQSVEKQKIVLRTKGKQKRDFIAVSDIAQALYILLRAKPGDIMENIFNLGGDNLLSVYELARLVAQTYFEVYGKEVKIEFDKNAVDEQSIEFTYDISRIKKLGYVPKAEVKEEIKEMLRICKGDFVA